MNATLINPFKVYVPSERDIVAVVSALIPQGKIKFIPNTLKKYRDGVNKAVGVILTNKKGESTTLPCSKAVSKAIVSALDSGTPKADCLAVIAKLEVTQFEHNQTHEMVQVISAPVGVGGEEEELNIAQAVSNTATYEDLA